MIISLYIMLSFFVTLTVCFGFIKAQMIPCTIQTTNPFGVFGSYTGICTDSLTCSSLFSFGFVYDTSGNSVAMCGGVSSCCYQSSATATTTSTISPVQTYCGVALNGGSNGGGSGIISRGDDDTAANELPQRIARILGGTPVTNFANYCWIVAIYSNNNFMGAGALINSQWVITTNNVASSASLTVRVGQISALGNTGTAYQVLNIRRYPGYTRIQPLGYPIGDVALLQLATPVDFVANPTVCAACIPNSLFPIINPGTTGNHTLLGRDCHVAGYGTTAQNQGTTDGILRDLDVQVIPVAVCNVVYRHALTQLTYNTDMTSFCAGGIPNQDTCVKDGGAPLSCTSVANPYPIVFGLSSWGLGCGRSGVPSVYTDLMNYNIRQFIQNTVGAIPAYPISGTIVTTLDTTIPLN